VLLLELQGIDKYVVNSVVLMLLLFVFSLLFHLLLHMYLLFIVICPLDMLLIKTTYLLTYFCSISSIIFLVVG